MKQPFRIAVYGMSKSQTESIEQLVQKNLFSCANFEQLKRSLHHLLIVDVEAFGDFGAKCVEVIDYSRAILWCGRVSVAVRDVHRFYRQIHEWRAEEIAWLKRAISCRKYLPIEQMLHHQSLDQTTARHLQQCNTCHNLLDSLVLK